MKSKTSSFNRGMWVQSFRNAGWIGLIYFLLLLFAVPLQLIMKYTGEVNIYLTKPKTLFELFDGIQIVFIFTVPVLLGIFLFRYIQTKASADYIHSLPVRRETLFHQNIFIGSILLIVPVLITAIIVGLIKGMLNTADLYTLKDVILWASYTIMFNLFVFFGTVAVGMFTGMSVLQGIFLYILFLLPGGLAVLVLTNINFYWHGFAYNFYINQNLENIFPYINATRLLIKMQLSVNIWFYLALIVIFYAVGFISYRKRDIESATQSIAFRWLKPIFVYGVTLCAMLLGGVYFGEIQQSFSWMIFGYILGSIIGYITAQIVLNKTWRVLHKWKGYLVFAGIATIIAAFINLDMFGYQANVPEESEIKGVYFDEAIYPLTEDPQNYENEEYEGEYQPPYYYESKESIVAIRKLHEQLAKDQVRVKPSERNSDKVRTAVFAYKLANGKQVVREYELEFNSYRPLYKTIVETNEFKENFHPFLRKKDFSQVTEVVIHAEGQNAKEARITDPKLIEEFVNVIKLSMKNDTFEDMSRKRDSWASIEFLDNEGKRLTWASWEKSYDEVAAWLKKHDLYEETRILPKEISKVVVIKNPEQHAPDFYADEHFSRLSKTDKVIQFKEEAKIEEALEKAAWNHNGPYLVGFYYKDSSSPEVKIFTEENIPEFVKERLK
ncbi:multidrug ABC transporter permease [Priestia megaterium]|nr:multidrug ABC transporter permease [Priestia megaterium]